MKKYGCPSDNCMAADPHISSKSYASLPEEVQQELKNRNLDKGDLKRCSYCGNVWVEKWDYEGRMPRQETTIIGIQKLGTDEMSWPILNRQK